MTSEKSPDAFRTISEVARELDLPQHVLRFWETKFSQIKPMKRGGGRRYYRPGEVEFLRGIRHLLYVQGYTIKGAQKVIAEHGVLYVTECWQDGQVAAAETLDAAKQSTVQASVPDQTDVQDAPGKKPEIAAQSGTASIGISPDVKRSLRSVLTELREARDMLHSVQVEKSQ